jgi:hypothetical protein
MAAVKAKLRFVNIIVSAPAGRALHANDRASSQCPRDRRHSDGDHPDWRASMFDDSLGDSQIEFVETGNKKI